MSLRLDLVGLLIPTLMTNAERYDTATTGMESDSLSCRVARMFGTAAGRVNKAANYVGERDPEDLLDEARNLVRRNPGPSLAIAAALGLAIGWVRRK